MNERETKFNEAIVNLRDAKLSENRKRDMLARIYEASPIEVAIPSPWSFFMFSRQYAAGFAVFAFLLLSGTAYASTYSLPGDLLYGLKVNVMEPISLSAHLSEESRQEYRVELLQERIEEIQMLRETGHLTPVTNYESYAATGRTVANIEAHVGTTSAQAKVEISTQIDTYNSLVGEEFHIKSLISEDDSKLRDDGLEDRREEGNDIREQERESGRSEETEKEVDEKREDRERLLEPLEERGRVRETTESIRDTLGL